MTNIPTPQTTPPNHISKERLQELLAAARAKMAAAKQPVGVVASLQKQIATNNPQTADLSKLGITTTSLDGPHLSPAEKVIAHDTATEILAEVLCPPGSASTQPPIKEGKAGSGVSRNVSLNEKQNRALELICAGEDICLLGAAGTGKTTGVGAALKELVAREKLTPIGAPTKHLTALSLGILICSFTRKAVNNIRRALPSELRGNALTLHKALEFAPVFYEVEDETSPNGYRKTMSFEPTRNALNPLPPGLTVAIFEESSMIGTELYNLWRDATPHLPQEVFIGDIQQLPPVFGSAILGYKMAILPVVELTEVYRQALQSPIIRLAHAVLKGDPYLFNKTIKIVNKRKVVPSLDAFNESSEHGLLKFQIWQSNLQAERACYAAVSQFVAWIDDGYYDPYDDIILCPFDKLQDKKGNALFSCRVINQELMQVLGDRRGAKVHEIIAGFNKHYYAIGDRVLFDKEDAIITEIVRNGNYSGKRPQDASVELNRDGTTSKKGAPKGIAHSTSTSTSNSNELELVADDLDDILADYQDSMGGDDSIEDRVRAASHTVAIKYSFSGEEVRLSTSAEINNLLGGHALTVHKFQGSENRAVFLAFHHSHSVALQREMLYTAITRAREKLHIICEADTFWKGVKSQKVKGTTIADKIDFFKGKANFLEMEREMASIKKQKEEKDRRRKWEAAKQLEKERTQSMEMAKAMEDWRERDRERDAAREAVERHAVLQGAEAVRLAARLEREAEEVKRANEEIAKKFAASMNRPAPAVEPATPVITTPIVTAPVRPLTFAEKLEQIKRGLAAKNTP